MSYYKYGGSGYPPRVASNVRIVVASYFGHSGSNDIFPKSKAYVVNAPT
jgi:hypothetical protein